MNVRDVAFGIVLAIASIFLLGHFVSFGGSASALSDGKALDRAIAVLSPIAAILTAWIVAINITLRLKRIDVTLDFSKRFGELLAEGLNLDAEREKEGKPSDASFLRRSEIWWERFFDLQLNQYDCYMHNLILRERFISWMETKREYFKKPALLVVAGMNYREGWAYWIKRKGPNQRLVPFLKEIHGGENETASRRDRNVRAIVSDIVFYRN